MMEWWRGLRLGWKAAVEGEHFEVAIELEIEVDLDDDKDMAMSRWTCISH